MKRRLTILALSALILVPAIGRADDSIGEKAESAGNPTKQLAVELTAVAQ